METKGEENWAPFDRVFGWKNNPVRARLYGRRCRILAKGSSKLSCLVEFEDGERHVTSIRALRKSPLDLKDAADADA